MGFLGTPMGFIMYWLFSFVNNYGWSLILFVLIFKISLLPLDIKQKISTIRTSAIQPKIQALQKKCGQDKARYQEELMSLYEQEGVSMTAGCMPMMVQMILLFGIIDVVYKPLKHILRIDTTTIDTALDVYKEFTNSKASSELVLINNIKENITPEVREVFTPEQLQSIMDFDMIFLGMNLGSAPKEMFSGFFSDFSMERLMLICLPLISGLMAFLMSNISMKQQEKAGQVMQQSMKTTLMLMPLMSVYIGYTLPAGVGIYWVISSTFSIVLTLVLGKALKPEKLVNSNSKAAQKNREKMKKRRERMEAYNEMLAEKNGTPVPKKSSSSADNDSDTPELSSKQLKELNKSVLEQARQKMKEKYDD